MKMNEMKKKEMMKNEKSEVDWSEEALMAEYGPVQSRKVLLPLWICKLLRQNTSVSVHMSKEEVRRRLDRYPAALSADSKSVRRAIETLKKIYPIEEDETGVWYNKAA